VLVEEVLQCVEESGAFWSQWWTRQDLTSPGDWVVHPREGLELVLRLWSGEEPALFSVLRVGDVGRPELPDA
jgi:hypothetical protein